MELVPRVLFIELVHESLDNGQRLTGAKQKVAFFHASHVDLVRSVLLVIHISGLESLAPPAVVIDVGGLSRIFFQGRLLRVEAASLLFQMCEPRVVVGVDVGQIGLEAGRETILSHAMPSL